MPMPYTPPVTGTLNTRLGLTSFSECGETTDYVEDHRTFSCCIRKAGATAIDAPAVAEGKAELFGRKLTREEVPIRWSERSGAWSISLPSRPSVAAHVAGDVSPGDTDEVSSAREERRSEG